MAAYHCTAKMVSRSKGQSAIAKAAYNARDRLVDEQTGEVKDHRRNQNPVLFSGLFAPKDAPEWAQNRNELWNHAEQAEKRQDAQLAREVEVALPHELSEQQREWLIKDFVRENFTRAGMVADVNIHAPSRDGDERNIHAHILLTTREIGADGFGKKNREWNAKDLLEAWREDYAEKGAKMLERAGFPAEAERFRWGHLTLAEQREKAQERGDLEFADSLDRAPTTHRGVTINQIEQRGEVSYVQAQRQEAFAREREDRAELTTLRAELAGIEREEAILTKAETPARAAERDAPAAELAGGKDSDLAGVGVQPEKAVGVVLDATAEVMGRSTDFAAESFGSLFETAKPPPTAQQIEQAEERAAAREEKQQAEDLKKDKFDMNRYLTDTDYRIEVVKKQYEEREAQKKREESENPLDRGRERDRDRER